MGATVGYMGTTADLYLSPFIPLYKRGAVEGITFTQIELVHSLLIKPLFFTHRQKPLLNHATIA